MMRLVVSALLVTLAISAPQVSIRQKAPVLGGDSVPDPDRTCTKAGEKCAGAPNLAEDAEEDDAVTTVVPTVAGGTTRSVITDSEDADSTVEPDDDEDDVEDDDDDDDDGSVCFPADAIVELADGSSVRMDALSLGDMVKVGPDQFSRVFMFTHKLSDAEHTFVSMTTVSGAKLMLTKGHYLQVNGVFRPAGDIQVNDEVTLGSGARDVVSVVRLVRSKGLYNPQTVNGNIVVNGVLSSTYTTAVEPVLAHAILSPFRFLNHVGLQFTFLEKGGGVLAELAPRGRASL